MTDTHSSGDTLAPAADRSAPEAGAETPAGNFGNTRGSGLARGKRPSGAAAPATGAANADYKPTSVQVITPEREYKNPFASPEPATAPSSGEAKDEAPKAEAVVAQPEPAVEVSAPPVPEPVEERSELQILPPAESARPAVSWESHSTKETSEEPSPDERPFRDDRPTFRADRREDLQGEAPQEADNARYGARDPRRDAFQRQPRDPRDARQHRDPREARQPRDPREARQPRDPRDGRPQFTPGNPGNRSTEAPKPASVGFLGWLKGLFGAKKAAEAPPAERENPSGPFEGGHRHRRRHRGGRGHGGNPQGYRGEHTQQAGDRPSHGGDFENRGGERHGGPRRRRHRGGRGRDRGGEPRSEGHQGGGAI